MSSALKIIGGGLAGSEAAWQAAERGIEVHLYEMRPIKNTPAHTTEKLAELVCSNSLGSLNSTKAPGLLKAEMRGLGSLILYCAEQSILPAGSALAVDRDRFAELVTNQIKEHSGIQLIRQEVKEIPMGPTIIATGPLTADDLADAIGQITGQDHLYFYDALAPIVLYESIDMGIAFRGSRYNQGIDQDGDYINCPLTEDEYVQFREAAADAEQISLREFEREDEKFFEACLPMEVIARRSIDGLRYGPMRPVGLTNPHTGERPYAVVQLRQDNLAGTLYNLVGFQTNLRWGEQKRVIRLIPGLEAAEFMRYGMMHRNTYINSPTMLHSTMQARTRADLLFAGQIVGAEGYMTNAATGLVAGINAARLMQGQLPVVFPPVTMIGSLCYYITHADSISFQPMKPNFGLLPFPQERMKKDRRYEYYRDRALKALRRFTRANDINYDAVLAESDIGDNEITKSEPAVLQQLEGAPD